jgi:hypothetical protein
MTAIISLFSPLMTWELEYTMTHRPKAGTIPKIRRNLDTISPGNKKNGGMLVSKPHESSPSTNL